jgi:hypothetical protein
MASRCTTLIKVEIFAVEVTPYAWQLGFDAELVLLQEKRWKSNELGTRVHDTVVLKRATIPY